jgi:imidazole glycerol-phosphate synthase subunit HisH
MKKIAIVDFEGGNLFSVIQACKSINLNANVTNDYKEILKSDGLILPGVGSYPAAMKVLNRKGLIAPIKEFVSSKKPFMGICLGFQLLFSKSEEFESCKGLDIIKGSVKKFNFEKKNIKVPHVGWNKIYHDKSWICSPLEKVKKEEYMYFVHSYYVDPFDKNNILSYTKYEGFEYCSSIKKENIFATQFHPEKSGLEGLKIYKKWSQLL